MLWRSLGAAVCLFALVASSLGADEEGVEDPADLTVEIVGLERVEGQVRIAVFDSEETWLGQPVHAKVVEVESRECSWTFENVAPGAFGIVLFHDLNANGQNDRNFSGIPKEPYGFSNNQRARFGSPSWSKASFSVSPGANTVRIRVR